jgi:hypothetical protein
MSMVGSNFSKPRKFARSLAGAVTTQTSASAGFDDHLMFDRGSAAHVSPQTPVPRCPGSRPHSARRDPGRHRCPGRCRRGGRVDHAGRADDLRGPRGRHLRFRPGGRLAAEDLRRHPGPRLARRLRRHPAGPRPARRHRRDGDRPRGVRPGRRGGRRHLHQPERRSHRPRHSARPRLGCRGRSPGRLRQFGGRGRRALPRTGRRRHPRPAELPGRHLLVRLLLRTPGGEDRTLLSGDEQYEVLASDAHGALVLRRTAPGWAHRIVCRRSRRATWVPPSRSLSATAR